MNRLQRESAFNRFQYVARLSSLKNNDKNLRPERSSAMHAKRQSAKEQIWVSHSGSPLLFYATAGIRFQFVCLRPERSSAFRTKRHSAKEQIWMSLSGSPLSFYTTAGIRFQFVFLRPEPRHEAADRKGTDLHSGSPLSFYATAGIRFQFVCLRPEPL